jgi:hypothetical protein
MTEKSEYRRGALVVGLMRLMKVRGAQSKPTMSEREKFRVASVDRKRPRGRREKDFIRRYCWGLGVKAFVSKRVKKRGRTALAIMQV